MKIERILTITMSCLIAINATALHAAEPKFDPDAAAKNIAPFVDEFTLVVVRVDPRRIDADALAKRLDPFPIPADEKKMVIAALKAWVDDYNQKGGREIYLIYGAGDFPEVPCLLTPIAESPAERKDLYELLKMLYDDTPTQWINHRGFLCVGPKTALDRLKQRTAAPRPEIAAAFAACGDGIGQAIFVPSAQSRKIFEEVAPTLPKELGGGPITAFTRDLKWAAFGLGTTPKLPLHLILQTTSEAAAEKLSGILDRVFAWAEQEIPQGDDDESTAMRTLFKLVRGWVKPAIGGPAKDRLLIVQDVETMMPALARLAKDSQGSAATIVSQNNLKQIGLACHNYLSAYNDRFPTDIRDKDGKALLSWRVAILPFLDQQALYKEFKLDEPWDSEHNKKLISKIPKVYISPLQDSKRRDRTTYLAPLGKGMMWEVPQGIPITKIPDGTSNTILVVEASDERAAIWTKPEDIPIDVKNPLNGLMGHYEKGFMVLLCDGSVRMVPKTYSAIHAMFTRDGGEVLPEK